MPLFGRTKRPVTCHFCSQSTTVPIPHKSGWICPDSACGQYNGFTADGDYNLNINREFASKCSTKSMPPRHCKPTPLPFAQSNAFHSDSHFHRDSFIPSSASAPLCKRCVENQALVQQKLQGFDPGANSNYNAFIEYRALLEKQYPLCSHCSTQSQYRLNAVNHNARLWQKYQDSLPTPNLKPFSKTSPQINEIPAFPGNQLNHINLQNNKSNCCSATCSCASWFMRCILNTSLCYLSTLTTVIGLCTVCSKYWNTTREVIHQCDIEWNIVTCQLHGNTGSYNTPCVYIHHLRSAMEGYLCVFSTIWTQTVLSLLLLLLLWMCSSGGRMYTLLFLSNFILVLIPILPEDSGLIGLYTGEIYVLLQCMMSFLCLLYISVSSSGKNDGNVSVNVAGKPIVKPDGFDLLNLLEEQEKSEVTPPLQSNGRKQRQQTKQKSPVTYKATQQKSTSFIPQTPSRRPFFPPFNPNGQRTQNQWADIKLTDPFVGDEKWRTPQPKHLKQQNYSQNNRRSSWSAGDESIEFGTPFSNFRNVNKENQPMDKMDLCSPFTPSMRRMQQRIGGLDLNSTF